MNDLSQVFITHTLGGLRWRRVLLTRLLKLLCLLGDLLQSAPQPLPTWSGIFRHDRSDQMFLHMSLEAALSRSMRRWMEILVLGADVPHLVPQVVSAPAEVF